METERKNGKNKAVNKEKFLKILKEYSIITLGCIIYSLGVAVFLDPNKIAPGGVTGIATVINSVLNGKVISGLNIETNRYSYNRN